MLWEIIVEIRDILESTHRISEMVNHKAKVEVYRTESKENQNEKVMLQNINNINNNMSSSDHLLD